MREAWVWSLGWEDPKEKREATHSSILAWRTPPTVEPMGSQRVGHSWDLATTAKSLCSPSESWGVGAFQAPGAHAQTSPQFSGAASSTAQKDSMHRGRNHQAPQRKRWTRTAQGGVFSPLILPKRCTRHEFGAGLCGSNQIFFFKYLCTEILSFFWLEVSPVQNCRGPEN